jgi:hypothetical protein
MPRNKAVGKPRRKYCLKCHIGFITNAGNQKYCPDCSISITSAIKRNLKQQSRPHANIQQLPVIERGSCCAILKSHHNILNGDPEHLSTEFIKNLSQCNCKEI